LLKRRNGAAGLLCTRWQWLYIRCGIKH